MGKIRRIVQIGVGIVAAVGACNHDKSAPVPVSSAAPGVSSGVSASGPTTSTVTTPSPHDPAPVGAAAAGEPPASFAGAPKLDVEGAVGLGCEAKSQDGWLELLCRTRNGTGGHPVRAVLDADAGTETLADEHSELRFTVQLETAKDIPIEWSDTTHILHVEGGTAKLTWVGGLPLRRACSTVLDSSKAVLAKAQKADADGRVLPADGAKLPRLGVCFPAGKGSYAIALAAIGSAGEGDQRSLHAELEVVHVDLDGKVLRAPYARFEFAPGSLSMAPLQVYDFDDDGSDEVIVPYELVAARGEARAPAAIWSVSETSIAPYGKAPAAAPGGVAIEQLDFDRRPDIGTYGPFVGWLGADCGSDGCPSRIVGPVLYAHSLPDGTFSEDDSATKGALKRACSKKPESLLVMVAKKAQIAQTAKNVACARVWGATTEAVVGELDAHRDALCTSADHCALLDTLKNWAKAPTTTL